MAVSDGGFGSRFRMAVSDGGFGWRFRMAVSDGGFERRLQGAVSGGGVKWWFQVAVSFAQMAVCTRVRVVEKPRLWMERPAREVCADRSIASAPS